MLPKHSPAAAPISCDGRTAGTRPAASIPTRLSQNTGTPPCNESGPTHRYQPTALEVFSMGQHVLRGVSERAITPVAQRPRGQRFESGGWLYRYGSQVRSGRSAGRGTLPVFFVLLQAVGRAALWRAFFSEQRYFAAVFFFNGLIYRPFLCISKKQSADAGRLRLLKTRQSRSPLPF